jgi:AAA domain (dynein-related subfamily)
LSVPETSDGLPEPSKPTHNAKTGLIEPTVADAMFLAISAPGYDGATGLNLLVWGDPGVGKTATAKDVLRRSGKHAFYVDLSLSAPEDLAGIPRVVFAEISEDGRVLNYYFTTDEAKPDPVTGKMPQLAILSVRAIDATWMNIFNDPKAVLVADDLTNAAQMVQASLLRIALEKQVSDGKGGLLSLKHMAVLAMANFGDGNALQPLLGPLANRFSHLSVVMSDVVRYYESGEKSQLTIDTKLSATLDAKFPALYDKYRGLVRDFVVEHGVASFDRAPTQFDSVEQHAYASPRSYEFCARWLAVCEHFGVQPDRFIRASIGAGKGGMLISWLRTRELGLQAISNKIDWANLDIAECNNASMWAARHFTGADELRNVVRSIDRLRKLRDGSNDNNVPARDYLIHRALGLPVGPNGQVDAKKGKVEPALTDDEIFVIRSAWNSEFLHKRTTHAPEQTGPDASGQGLAA